MFSGCKEGCKDKDATNFCSDCDEDNGTCFYTGNMVLWFNSATSALLKSKGHTELSYFVNEQLQITKSSNIAWTGAPHCGQDQSVTAQISLSKLLPTRSIKYRVINQVGTIVWEGETEVNSRDCIQVELTNPK